MNDGETIALFGGNSSTGKELLKLALDAGYNIKMLMQDPTEIELENENLTVLKGGLDDAELVEEVIYEANYVVCLAAETLPKKEYKEGFMIDFVKLLYPIMNKVSPSLFLYQASWLCADADKKIPVFSNVTNKASNLLSGENLRVKDHNAVIQFMVEQSRNVDFPFMVTRPGMRKRGRAKKKLFASKSQPTPFPYTHADLAEFTLGALKTEKLYNRFPYVVGDGF